MVVMEVKAASNTFKRHMMDVLGREVHISWGSDNQRGGQGILQGFNPRTNAIGVVTKREEGPACQEHSLNDVHYLSCVIPKQSVGVHKPLHELNKFKTDAGYHDSSTVEFAALVEWEPEEDDALPADKPDERIEKWTAEDMFLANEKFGYRSNFVSVDTQYCTAQPVGTEEDRRRAEQMANEIERNQESRHNQQLENDDEERDLDKETAFREAAEAHTDLNTTRTAAPQRRDFHRTRPFESAAKPQGQRAPPLVVPKCAGNGPRPNLTPSATPGNKKDPSPKPPKEQRSSPAPAQEVPAKQAFTTAPRAKEEVKKPKPSAEPVPVPPAKPAPPKKEPSISPKKTNNSVVAGKEAPAKKEVPKKKTSVPERAPSATPSVTPSMDDNASVVSATSTLSRKHSFNPHAVEFKPRAVPAAARSQAHTPTSPVQHMSQPQAPLQAVPPSALQHHMQLPPPHSGGMTMQHTPPTVPHMMTGNPYQVFQPPLQQPPQQMFLAQPQQQQQQHADYYLAQPQQQPQQQDFMQPVPVYYNMAAQQMGQLQVAPVLYNPQMLNAASSYGRTAGLMMLPLPQAMAQQFMNASTVLPAGYVPVSSTAMLANGLSAQPQQPQQQQPAFFHQSAGQMAAAAAALNGARAMPLASFVQNPPPFAPTTQLPQAVAYQQAVQGPFAAAALPAGALPPTPLNQTQVAHPPPPPPAQHTVNQSWKRST